MPVANKPRRAFGNKRHTTFISRNVAELRLGTNEFRFAGSNTFGLGLFYATFPSIYWLDDSLATAAGMGCNVLRVLSLMPGVGNAQSWFPDGVTLNENAALAADKAIAKAADYNIRLVIPLCDPWGHYFGSITDWSTLLGGGDFYTNATVITGFKAAVTQFINRINKYTGVRYGDDPTILCWETGNELNPAESWTANICDHLKTLAPNHLVKSGRDLQNINAADMANVDVDIVGNHYYQGSHDLTAGRLAADLAIVDGDKVFATLEYDWNNVRGGDDFVATFGLAMIANKNAMPGQAYWSIATHHDTEGYDTFSEYESYTCFTPLAQLDFIRQLGVEIREIPATQWPVPGVPRVTGDTATILHWRAVANARHYRIERSAESANTGFVFHSDGYDAEDSPYSADMFGWYRVRAVNANGIAGNPSNAVMLLGA